MTMQTEQTSTTTAITTDAIGDIRATKDQLKIISRLALQRIMSSEALQYLRKHSADAVSSQFLSDTPEKEISLYFSLPSDRERTSYYSNSVCEMSMKWLQSPDEIVDLEGNAWSTYCLVMNVTLGSFYNIPYKSFEGRAEVIQACTELFEEINDLAPEPVRVLTLNNEERISRDETRRVTTIGQTLADMFVREHRAFRRGLRVGGRGKPVPREIVNAVTGTKPGTYEFTTHEGSRRRPVVRQYVLKVPVNASWLATLSRVR